MTGYTYFIPSEEHLESRVTTRSFMEARMVVALAGRRAPSYRLSRSLTSSSAVGNPKTALRPSAAHMCRPECLLRYTCK